MRCWHIYALIDPRTNEIRYIGWSVNPQLRLSAHCSEAKKNRRTYKDKWILGLLAQEMRPVCTILEEGTGDWASAEMKWIRHYRALGARLVNGTDGGEGTIGRIVSQEIRDKIARGKTGKKMSPEAVERMAASRRGKPLSDSLRQKLSIAHAGKPKSESARASMAKAQQLRMACPVTRKEFVERIRNARMAAPPRTLSEDHRAAIGRGITGRVVSEASRQKIAATNRATKALKDNSHTPEARAKISAGLKGRPVSDETRALRSRLASSQPRNGSRFAPASSRSRIPCRTPTAR